MKVLASFPDGQAHKPGTFLPEFLEIPCGVPVNCIAEMSPRAYRVKRRSCEVKDRVKFHLYGKPNSNVDFKVYKLNH